MKKPLKILTMAVAFFAISSSVTAGTVSVAKAQNVAISFFNMAAKNLNSRASLTATLIYTQTEADNTVDFYVFDMAPVKGFVIVPADDRVLPVIAYSTESNFNIPAKGSAVQCWMNHAGAHIYHAIQRNSVPDVTISNQWGAYLQGQRPTGAKSLETGVVPLLSTNWAQEPYYNQLCPFNTTDNKRTVTGCVATAMAQIMKYWNYPAQGTGQYGYLDAPPTCFNTYGDQFANFGATVYNWAGMPDSLNSNNLAVATLMYQCGVAVAMDYGDDNQGGSGSYVLASDVAGWRHTAQMAYTTYFGYNGNTLQGVHESDYTPADWLNLMENELNAGRPIQYEGTDTNYGSHTWVCDGYDANDMLHMNWGWGGLDNGYYSIASLTADGYNFSSSEEALIGIEPVNDLNVSATVADAAICSGSSTTLTAQGGPVNASYNWTPVTGLSCPTCAVTSASPAATTVYTLTMDSAGLSAMAHVTVIVNSKMNIESTEVTDVTCFGAANGSVRVEVSGGAGAYAYLWNNGSDSAAVINLQAGSYAITVTDAKSCTISAGVTVAQPNIIAASINIDNAICSLNNAALNAAAQGGTPPYSFEWGLGQTTPSVSSPDAGNYTVTVLDAAGCSASASALVAQPTAMNVEITSSNTSCSLLYATATANVTGGNQNFSYAWSNGENTASITNLNAGNFSVTVTDALGCSSSASQSFTQPDSMNISITTSEITDKNIYAKAIANVTGGIPEYSYLWNTGALTPEISGLAPGTYTVTITDTKGCSQTAATQVSETTGVNNAESKIDFELYPNPATTFITIAAYGGYENTTVEVKTPVGQTLMTGRVTSAETQLDLSNLASGYYLVALTRGQNTSVREITVQK